MSCETITSNTSNHPVSKTPYKGLQDNQRERGIPNKVDNPCGEHYRGILQDWLPWDKKLLGQRKSELFTRIHSPGLRPERKT